MPNTFSRRTFNKLGLLSSGALLVPSLASAGPAPSSVPLTDDERVLLESFAETMIPTEGTSLKPRSEVPILANVEHAFALMEEPILEQVRLGLQLFDYGSILIGFHFARFPNLSLDDRLAYIHRWEDGVEVQRGIVGVIKKLMCYAYWGDMDAAASLGYPGPVSAKAGIPNLGNAPMPKVT